MKFTSKLLEEVDHFIYPKLCFQCDSELTNKDSSYICLSCESFLEIVTEEELAVYHQHYLSNFFYKSFIAYHFDEASKKYLHLIKYRHGKTLAKYVGELIVNRYQETLENEGFDLIISCPLYKSRLYERDYNQSDYIAKSISELLNVKTDFKLLKRVKKTKTQTKLSKLDRQKNLSSAFTCNEKIKNYRNILIIDDVITTGATMNEIAKTILSVHSKAKLSSAAFASPI